MATQGNQVKFFYAASTTALPATRDADTIYFDAQAKAIYVGSQIIAADNAAQDLSGFIVKNNAEAEHQIKLFDNGGTSNYVINGINESRVYFSATNYTPSLLVNVAVADPTEDSDAATKSYVDAHGGPTWTVG